MPRLGISRRRHLPVVKLLDHSESLLSFPSLVHQFWSWRLEEVADSLVQVSTPLDKLVMSRDRAGMMLYEWSTWTKCYAPPGFDFSGKTILDVGAGEGETVEFYRLHGARKFVCVEPDLQRASRLRDNCKRNAWEAEVYEEPFSSRFLRLRFDFMKMDCEGCEQALIGTPVTFPCVLETHGSATKEFLAKGFSVLRIGSKTSLVTNVRSPGSGRD